MTPTNILAAARSNPLSAIVPAREEWLNGYEGSLRYMGEHGPIAAWRIGGGDDHHHVVFVRGLSVDAVTCGAGRLHFDLRIPSVRDWLIRCGAPAMCREHVVRALAWVLTGVGAMMLFLPVASDEEALSWVTGGAIVPFDDGWYIPLLDGKVGWLPREAA